MLDLSRMISSAHNALIQVMGLEKSDRVLVITDARTGRVGEAFLQGAARHGCAVQSYVLPEADRPLAQIPAAMRELLPDTTVVINVFEGNSAETPFRVQWIKSVLAEKTRRLGHGPGITEAMMTEGPMNVDFHRMHDAAQTLIAAFAGAQSVHVTAPGGTDIVLRIAERTFLSDTKITSGHGGNLPCGEIYCAPVEDGADGVLVADGSIGDLGNITSPLRISVRHGKIESLECQDRQLTAEVERLTGLDAEASVIGELGIGLNPGARLSGQLLEDEKAIRTAHIAFGNNDDMPGGRNRSCTHRDFLFHRPTMVVTVADGSRQTLLRDGEIQLPG